MSICYPVLDEAHQDTVTDHKKIIDHMLAFIMANPGEVSTLHNKDTHSFGIVDMKHGSTPNTLASGIVTMLQDALDQTFGSGTYMADVDIENGDDAHPILRISVVDNMGKLMLDKPTAIEKVVKG